MPIALLTTLDRTAATFVADVDELFTNKLNTFIGEANATAAALTLNATSDTSATSHAITPGDKTFTVSSGKSFQPGMYLVIADTAAASTNSMYGQITTYSTNQLLIKILSIRGSGTKTAWTISQSAAGFGTAADLANTPAAGITEANVQGAVNGLETRKANIADVQAQTYTAFTTTGTATAFAIAPSPVLTGYAANQAFFVNFHVASGAAPTLTINGLATPPQLVKRTGAGGFTNLLAGDIPAGHRSYVMLINATQALVETLPDNGAVFGAYATAAQSLANLTFTKINFPTEEFDTAGAFDAVTNSRFVAPAPGFFQFNAAVSILGTTGNDYFISLYKNGVEFKRGARGPVNPAGVTSVTVAAMIQLAVGDFVEIYAYQGSGAAQNTSPGALTVYFNGFMARAL